jgi:hypothetical protein
VARTKLSAVLAVSCHRISAYRVKEYAAQLISSMI